MGDAWCHTDGAGGYCGLQQAKDQANFDESHINPEDIELCGLSLAELCAVDVCPSGCKATLQAEYDALKSEHCCDWTSALHAYKAGTSYVEAGVTSLNDGMWYGENGLAYCMLRLVDACELSEWDLPTECGVTWSPTMAPTPAPLPKVTEGGVSKTLSISLPNLDYDEVIAETDHLDSIKADVADVIGVNEDDVSGVSVAKIAGPDGVTDCFGVKIVFTVKFADAETADDKEDEYTAKADNGQVYLDELGAATLGKCDDSVSYNDGAKAVPEPAAAGNLQPPAVLLSLFLLLSALFLN